MVSVIIPVYKSEQTLRRCVESVLSQDYSDFEIILVVDGPPDGSGILALELSKMDERIFVINQSNQGVSKARNSGIMEARGEYIRFLDSDDYLPAGALGCMVKAITRDDSDLVIAGFHHLYYGKVVTKTPRDCGLIETKQAPLVMQHLYEDGFLNMPWNKLFKRESIADGFPQDISLGEDLIFNQNYIAKTSKISVIGECVCEYVQDDRGTTLSTKKRDDKIEMALTLFEKSYSFFQNLYGNDIDLCFLKDKVLTTFLDDLEQMGFSGYTHKDRKQTIRTYKAAFDSFWEQNGKWKIKLTLCDYKIIFFFFRRGFLLFTEQLILLRAIVVKIVRSVNRNGDTG